MQPLHRVSGRANCAHVTALTEYQPVELPRFRRVGIRHQMPIAVERRLDRGVAELGLDVLRVRLSLAKTSSDSLRSTEIRQSVHRPKTPSLLGGRATGIVRPSALHGHTGVAMEDGERAGWAAELDL